jgi:dihydropteroate synthase
MRTSVAGTVQLRGSTFTWGARTYVMGIVNATPDSFSGDGRPETDAAIAYALEQHAAGADLLDVGAESTRPGHAPIPVAQELARLIPVIRGLREQAPGAVISADTFKADVFRAAHAAGADILNSIWGLDDELLEAAVACDVPVIVMHNKRVAIYEHDVVDEVLSYLETQAVRATRAGIARERIILDPGIGFGKLPDHNLALLGSLERITALGFPTLLGTSRKSTIGLLTGKPVEERIFGTAASVALGVAAGIDVVRVHDVAAMRDVVAVADAVVRGWRPQGWK